MSAVGAALNRGIVRSSFVFVADVPREPDEVEAELLRRAQGAVEAAERIRARAEVLVGASVVAREAKMTTRCAWCSRYRFGEQWVLVEEPSATAADVTHGICEDCMAALRASGMSV
jgi:hypothetical protein